ncbi:hypothetical protein GCM10018771_35200 [Streptomyces cellulosae]|nr:hypothetical protein GCM10018771_35200 [Streptomyces cellulosae]
MGQRFGLVAPACVMRAECAVLAPDAAGKQCAPVSRRLTGAGRTVAQVVGSWAQAAAGLSCPAGSVPAPVEDSTTFDARRSRSR